MRSFVDFFANKSKYDLICKAWFGPDGTQRPSKEALATFYDDNYVKLIVKPFPYDQTDESKQNQAQATLRFLDAAKSKGFGLVILEEGLEAAANSVPAVSVAAKPDDSNPVEPGQQQPEANEQSTNTAPSAPENDAGKTNQNATVSAVGKDATREKRIAELEKQHTVIVTKEQLLEWLTASGAAEANIAPYGVPFALNLQRPRQFLVAQKQPKTEEDLQENTEAVVLGMMKPVLDKQIDEKASRVQFSETVVAIFSPGCLRG
jgi:hypothetical protein